MEYFQFFQLEGLKEHFYFFHLDYLKFFFVDILLIFYNQLNQNIAEELQFSYFGVQKI